MAEPKTSEERLALVRATIDAILTGGAFQSHTINGRDVSRIPLAELERYERKLERQIAASKGPQRNLARFPGE